MTIDWKPQEPGEPPQALPPDAPLPAHEGWGERPADYPEPLPWPPTPGPEAMVVAALWDLLPMPRGSLIRLDQVPHDKQVAAAEAVAPPTPAELARRADEARAADEAKPAPWTPEEEAAYERRQKVDEAARTANGMPYATGGEATQELARRLLRSREYQVLLLTMGSPGGWTPSQRVAYDLAITKLAARETRYEEHLYEFLARFSVAFPETGPGGEDLYYSPEREGYLVGTVREALKVVPPTAAEAAPPQTIAELAEDPDRLVPPAVVVPRLAWRGRDTLFAGREKLAGKSTLLTAGAAAVTRGTPFLGQPTTAAAVLWVSADLEPEADVVQRVLRFRGDPDRLKLAYPSGSFDARLDALVAHVADLDPALVVIDSLAHFMLVAEASQSTEWIDRFTVTRERLKPYDAARVWVHHTTKGTGEYRDSTAIGASVDQILYYENPDPKGGTAVRKVHGLGRIVGWRPFDVRLDGDAFVVDEGSADDEAKALAVIVANPGCGLNLIERAVGGRPKRTADALENLVLDSKIQNRGTGKKHAWYAV